MRRFKSYLMSPWYKPIVIILIALVAIFIFNLLFTVDNLTKIVNSFQLLQSIVTLAAVVFAINWFFLRRKVYGRLDLTQEIVKIDFSTTAGEFLLVRVIITVTNKGDVVFRPVEGVVFIQQVRPLPQFIQDRISAKKSLYDAKNQTTIDWDNAFQQDENTNSRDLIVGEEGLKLLEPGVTEQIYVDLILPKDADVVEIYTSIKGANNNKFSWMRKTIHFLKETTT